MIVAVCVTFNPDDGFKERLATYAGQVNRVLIVDNSTDPERAGFVQSLGVEVIANANHGGLAHAQNIGIRRALALGAEWVALFDDDSAASDNMFSRMLETWKRHPASGIVVPVVMDGRTGHDHRIITWVGPVVWRRRMGEHEMLPNVTTAIASGMLIRAALLKDCGEMREEYFIDWIDVEYCLRAQARGWKILAVGGTKLDHTLGDKQKHALAGVNFIASHHAPWRRYTISRNRMDVWKRYATRFPAYVVYDMLVAAYETLKILCFEQQKAAKLRFMLRGFSDGLRGHFPTPQP